MVSSAFFKSGSTARPTDTRAQEAASQQTRPLLQPENATSGHRSVAAPVSYAAGGGPDLSLASYSRPLHFPASRRYLWDSTPQAPTVYVQPAGQLPTVEVAPETLQAAMALLQAGPRQPHDQPSLTLTAQFRMDTAGRHCRMLLAPRQPGMATAPPGPFDMTLPCTLQLHDTSPAPATPPLFDHQRLRAALGSRINARGMAHMGQVYASAACMLIRHDGTAHLHGVLMLPGSPLSLSLLASKRLVDTPLSRSLACPPQPGTVPEDGYLTMDAARSLVPLQANDAQVFSVPLVGVWVRGVASVQHPLVLAACLRFMYSATLPDKAVNDSGAFLLIVYPSTGGHAPDCYEARFHDDHGRMALLQYQYQGELLQLAGHGGQDANRRLHPAQQQAVGCPVQLVLSLDYNAPQGFLMSPQKGITAGGAGEGRASATTAAAGGGGGSAGAMSSGGVRMMDGPPHTHGQGATTPAPASGGGGGHAWGSAIAGLPGTFTPALRASVGRMPPHALQDAHQHLSGMPSSTNTNTNTNTNTPHNPAPTPQQPAASWATHRNHVNPPPLPRPVGPAQIPAPSSITFPAHGHGTSHTHATPQLAQSSSWHVQDNTPSTSATFGPGDAGSPTPEPRTLGPPAPSHIPAYTPTARPPTAQMTPAHHHHPQPQPQRPPGPDSRAQPTLLHPHAPPHITQRPPHPHVPAAGSGQAAPQSMPCEGDWSGNLQAPMRSSSPDRLPADGSGKWAMPPSYGSRAHLQTPTSLTSSLSLKPLYNPLNRSNHLSSHSFSSMQLWPPQSQPLKPPTANEPSSTINAVPPTPQTYPIDPSSTAWPAQRNLTTPTPGGWPSVTQPSTHINTWSGMRHSNSWTAHGANVQPQTHAHATALPHGSSGAWGANQPSNADGSGSYPNTAMQGYPSDHAPHAPHGTHGTHGVHATGQEHGMAPASDHAAVLPADSSILQQQVLMLQQQVQALQHQLASMTHAAAAQQPLAIAPPPPPHAAPAPQPHHITPPIHAPGVPAAPPSIAPESASSPMASRPTQADMQANVKSTAQHAPDQDSSHPVAASAQPPTDTYTAVTEQITPSNTRRPANNSRQHRSTQAHLHQQQPVSSNDSSPVEQDGAPNTGGGTEAGGLTPYTGVSTWLAEHPSSGCSTPEGVAAVSRRELFGTSSSSSAASTPHTTKRASTTKLLQARLSGELHGPVAAGDTAPGMVIGQVTGMAPPISSAAQAVCSASEQASAAAPGGHVGSVLMDAVNLGLHVGTYTAAPPQTEASTVSLAVSGSTYTSMTAHSSLIGASANSSSGGGAAASVGTSTSGSRHRTSSSSAMHAPSTSSAMSALSPVASPAGSDSSNHPSDEDDDHPPGSRGKAARAYVSGSRSYATASKSITSIASPPSQRASGATAYTAGVVQAKIGGGDLVRTRYVPLDEDESEGSDSEMEAQLMRKYGLMR